MVEKKNAPDCIQSGSDESAGQNSVGEIVGICGMMLKSLYGIHQ